MIINDTITNANSINFISTSIFSVIGHVKDGITSFKVARRPGSVMNEAFIKEVSKGTSNFCF